MKKCLFICNSYPIQPRILKVSSIVESLGIECIYLVWDLESKATNQSQYYLFQRVYGYGHPIKKLFDSFGFIKYLKCVVEREKIDYVYAFSFDSMYCCTMLNKEIKVIYDIADLPIINVPFVDFFLKYNEKRNVQRADAILLASRFFQNYYKEYLEKCYIIENLPDFDMVPLQKKESDKLRVTFYGIIRYYEIMKNLIDAAENSNVLIQIYGCGRDEDQLRAYTQKKGLNNVKFYGRYDKKDIPKIYSNSDLIWAVYPSKGLNERVAISNKYFESIYYATPCMFEQNTMVGKLAVENGSGMVVNCYSVQDIVQKLNEFEKKDFFFDCNELKSFSNYTKEFSMIFDRFENS